jgi:hypothetical protein
VPSGTSRGTTLVKRRFSGISTVCSNVMVSPSRQA